MFSVQFCVFSERGALFRSFVCFRNVVFYFAVLCVFGT